MSFRIERISKNKWMVKDGKQKNVLVNFAEVMEMARERFDVDKRPAIDWENYTENMH